MRQRFVNSARNRSGKQKTARALGSSRRQAARAAGRRQAERDSGVIRTLGRRGSPPIASR
jgi:hypothetical protein